jgi:hypothetical protein
MTYSKSSVLSLKKYISSIAYQEVPQICSKNAVSKTLAARLIFQKQTGSGSDPDMTIMPEPALNADPKKKFRIHNTGLPCSLVCPHLLPIRAIPYAVPL